LSKEQTRSWSPEALSLTIWNGEVVHEKRSGAQAKTIADRAIREAIDRLRRNGFDIQVDEDNSASTATAPADSPKKSATDAASTAETAG
jgi:hypothetical protein